MCIMASIGIFDILRMQGLAHVDIPIQDLASAIQQFLEPTALYQLLISMPLEADWVKRCCRDEV
jgi:hypothetical protein